MLRRGVIPPIKGGGTGGLRGATDDIPTPNTIPGGIPKAGSGTSGSDIPRIGKGDNGANTYKPPVIGGDEALSPPNQYGSGTASSSTSLCARNKNTCDDMKDVAEELVEQIMDAIADAADEDSSSGDGEPEATATVISPTTARNMSSVAATPMPMPNLNMSSWMDLYDYRTLFTAEEYSMLQDDPLCFYANFGRLYENYAVESRTSTGSASEQTSTSATTTTAQAKRTAQPLPRDDDSTPCLGCGDVEDDDAPATATSIDESEARTLYLSYLPDQLRLVYTSTPTSLTATATSTTICSGLSGLGMESFETPYVVFGYRDGYAPSETASVDSTNEVTSGGVSGREQLMPLGGLVMLGHLWLARMV